MYKLRIVERWPVFVHREMSSQVRALTLREIREQLYRVSQTLPPRAVRALRKVPIFLGNNPPDKGITFRGRYILSKTPSWWSTEPNVAQDFESDDSDGYLPWSSIYLPSGSDFVAISRLRPQGLLHELSHAYHDLVIPEGLENRLVLACYERYKARRGEALQTYGVRHIRNRSRVYHYGMYSPMEYFAVSTEALFWRSDFYPFTRVDLKEEDPLFYRALVTLWEDETPLFEGTKKLPRNSEYLSAEEIAAIITPTEAETI